ncbi:MAG TPA: helix-turn-helix domain-containing protein [Terriglobales bacterium]|jgi:transposase|nr:helix-turn-helix domain-containing protein [Terriglobales bacterium]
MAVQQELPLPPPLSSEVRSINARCVLRAEGEYRVVVLAGLPVHHYSVQDAVAAAYAMVFLVDAGYATQKEVAVAFNCSERTVRRHQERYHEGGMTALATRSGWRAGRRRVPTKRLRVIQSLKAQGLSNREIARRLGVTENAIRQEVGPSSERGMQQQSLPLDSTGNFADQVSVTPAAAPGPPPLESTSPSRTGQAITEETVSAEPAAESVGMSLDRDPANRAWDRLLACFGLLDDAAPVFGSAQVVPGAAVLCALPVLVSSGVFRIAHKVYGEIGPAFYGLRTTLLTLLLMALWRIQRPEALKEYDPQILGRVMGLDRAPEIKTVRRKLTRLASYHKAEQLGAELARLRVDERGQLLGFLYVDGHVRAYHGQRNIPKAHVARLRLSMPATTDYWVNDQAGDPLLVITAAANAGLVKMLPEVLQEVRKLVGDRRVTVVFDRGGWSPKLFQKLLEASFDILTYRKGKSRRIAAQRFVLRRAPIDGRIVEYRLHDQAVRLLKGKLRLRQVSRLSDNGHQTQVITSRWDLHDIEVAYRMFERWRQENFFKYLREEFLIDALADYQVEPDDPTRTVPNPQRRALDKDIHNAQAELAELEWAYGVAAVDNPEGRRPTMRGFKIAHGQLGKQLRAARERLTDLLTRRRGIPPRVEVGDLSDGAVVKLATERKHLTNLIKMVAYQTESDLLAFLRPNYARSDDEGRTLLHELFHAAADLDVTETELRVTICPLSSPHRTLAVQALCDTLTETATVFPGTRLTMRFAAHPRPQVGLAFPGPRPRPAPLTAPSST